MTKELKKVRKNTDITMRLKLTSDGVAIDWKDVNNLVVCIYSDVQKSYAGNCDIVIDPADTFSLIASYHAEDQIYKGAHRVVCACEFAGHQATYDAPAFELVLKSSDVVPGQTTEQENSEIGIDLRLEDISTSVVAEIINAAILATQGAVDATSVATSAAGTATTQGNYAKEQGDYAKKQGAAAVVDAERVETAIEGANKAANSATTQANYAQEQGNHAKEQGDYAKEQGDAAIIDAQRVETAIQGATTQANYAQEQGDAAKDATQGAVDATSAATSAAGTATTQANYAQEQGNYAKEQAINAQNVATGYADELAKKQNASDAVGRKTAEGGEVFNVAISAGSNAHAEGTNTKATGIRSHAEGAYTESIGANSHAEGFRTNATGEASHAEGELTYSKAEGSHSEGYNTSSKGVYSHSEGSSTTSFGSASHSEGYSNNKVSDETLAKDNNGIIADWEVSKFSLAKGSASHVEGQDCLAFDISSHAEGIRTIAKLEASHSEGCQTISESRYSHAGGYNTIVKTFASMVCGQYNLPQEYSPVSWYPDQDVFSIGNGSSDTDRGNAFKVTGDGNVRADGTYESPAGDYAEMFEWADGNAKNEDRVGYIVAIEGEKIVKANGIAHIGIVSAKPSILGDNPMRWHDKYMTDEWGRTILEEKEVVYTENEEIPSEERDAMVEAKFQELLNSPYREGYIAEGKSEEEIAMEIAEDERRIRMEADMAIPRTREVEKTRTDIVQKLNPDYNPSQEYTPRTERKEWSAVGMMGKLLVRQDGSLKVGGRCSAKDGVATNDVKGTIYVMKVINERQALVLIK